MVLSTPERVARLADAVTVCGHVVVTTGSLGASITDLAVPSLDAVLAEPEASAAERLVASLRLDGAIARCPILVAGPRPATAVDDPYEAARLTLYLGAPFDADRLRAALDDIAADLARIRRLKREPLIDGTKIGVLRANFGLRQTARLLAMADEELALRPRRIRCLIAAGDHAMAVREAHALKGATWNIGAEGVAHMAGLIERSTGVGEATTALADDLVAHCDATRAMLLAS